MGHKPTNWSFGSPTETPVASEFIEFNKSHNTHTHTAADPLWNGSKWGLSPKKQRRALKQQAATCLNR